MAGADLILRGHTPVPLVLRTPLPSGRMDLVVRGRRGHERIGDVVLAYRWSADAGVTAWEIALATAPFQPRDATWT